MSASGAERKTNSNLGFKLATPSSKRDNETIKEGTTVGVSTIPLNFFDVAVAAAVAVTDKQLFGNRRSPNEKQFGIGRGEAAVFCVMEGTCPFVNRRKAEKKALVNFGLNPSVITQAASFFRKRGSLQSVTWIEDQKSVAIT